MSGDVSFNISKDLIESIVSTKVSAEIAKALNNSAMPDLILQVTEKAINQKVDYDGKINSYSSENKYNLIEMVARKAIMEETRKGINEWVESNREKIRVSIKKHLNKNLDNISASFAEALAGATNQSWRVGVELKVSKEKE